MCFSVACGSSNVSSQRRTELPSSLHQCPTPSTADNGYWVAVMMEARGGGYGRPGGYANTALSGHDSTTTYGAVLSGLAAFGAWLPMGSGENSTWGAMGECCTAEPPSPSRKHFRFWTVLADGFGGPLGEADDEGFVDNTHQVSLVRPAQPQLDPCLRHDPCRRFCRFGVDQGVEGLDPPGLDPPGLGA